MKKTYVLGLKTEAERRRAYRFAKQSYDLALTYKINPAMTIFAMGQISSILRLVSDEIPEDRELIERLAQLYQALSEMIGDEHHARGFNLPDVIDFLP
jgi:hypothetical protein